MRCIISNGKMKKRKNKDYEKKKTFYVNPNDMYSTVTPKYYGVNQEKYLTSTKIQTSMKLLILPIQANAMEFVHQQDNWSTP